MVTMSICREVQLGESRASGERNALEVETRRAPLDAHVRENGGNAINGADELRVSGFELGEGFLQAPEGCVGVIVRRAGIARPRGWQGTSFSAELQEELLEFTTFGRRQRLCGTEVLLNLGDSVLDHAGNSSGSFAASHVRRDNSIQNTLKGETRGIVPLE